MSAVPRKVYFSPEPEAHEEVSSLTILAGRQFAGEMGFAVVTPRTENAATYYGKLFQSWMTSDVFFAMYPAFGSPLTSSNPMRSVDRTIIPILRKMRKQTKSMLYVVDLPLERLFAEEDETLVDNTAVQLEKTLFSEFDILIVYNHFMKESIMEKYGVPEDRIVVFESLDYRVDFIPEPARELKKIRTIAYSGESSREDSVMTWFKDIPRSLNLNWEFMAPDGDWISSLGRDDIMSHGSMDAESMAGLLGSRADFGIICNKVDEKLDKQYDFVSTSMIGVFATAGVPVLVPSRYVYLCELVRNYDIGWVFDSPQEIPFIADRITPAEYNHVRNHVLELAQRLRNGYFFKNAVTEAMARLGFGPGA